MYGLLYTSKPAYFLEEYAPTYCVFSLNLIQLIMKDGQLIEAKIAQLRE